MLVAIGLMMGLYIMTRMVDILTRPSDRRPVLLIVFAVVTLIVTGLCTADFFVRALTGSTDLPGMP